MSGLRFARTCYRHLAGWLGVAIRDRLLERDLLREDGIVVSVRSVPAGQHSFIMGAGRVPEVDEAIQQMGRWLRSKLGLAALV